jgi:AcrR family transcriptional regulator
MTLEPLTPERRRAMTRQHLLEAAAIVFARNGFHGSTLDEVAATAGFTKGAVYSNFKSKEDLFLELLDDRMIRQFALVTEVLESGPHDQADQRPRMRDLVSAGMFWDDTWSVLYLEFVLYATRNPEARAKLAASAQHERARVQQMIETEYAATGAESPYPARDLAEISLALFNGFGIDRLINPDTVTHETLDTTLAVFYAMGGGPRPESLQADSGPPPDAPAPQRGPERSTSRPHLS